MTKKEWKQIQQEQETALGSNTRKAFLKKGGRSYGTVSGTALGQGADMKKQKFHNGDIVAIQLNGKYFVYIYRRASISSPVWSKKQGQITRGVVLTDSRSNIRRTKFRERDLILATKLIETMSKELDCFRNR